MKHLSRALLVLALMGFDVPSANDVPPQAPIAKRIDSVITQHGQTRIDPYAWMKDPNWQEVLTKPETLKADVIDHLEREVAFYEASTDHLGALRSQLVAEMRGRVKEDDASVPMPRGAFAYYTRFREGGQYPLFARKPVSGGAEQVFIDGDKEADGKDFFSLRGVSVSPDQTRVAYGVDTVGSEYYTIKVRNVETGIDLVDAVQRTAATAVWAADSASFFYIERDDNGRFNTVKHHVIGDDSKDDRTVYKEADDGLFLSVSKTSSQAYILISASNGDTSETHFIPADAPLQAPTLIAARQPQSDYSVEHRGDAFILLSHDPSSVDGRIVSAPIDAPGRENWRDVVAHKSGRYIADMAVFQDFLVREEREDALPRLVVSDSDGEDHAISFDEDAFALTLVGWDEFDTSTMRFAYESPSTPAQVFDYDMRAKTRVLRKTQVVPSGHDPDRYQVEMITVKARDGAMIPVSLLSLRSTPKGPDTPVMLYGYGSYGVFIPDNFNTNIFSIVDRGIVYAQAHVRGGSAKGRQWYLDGKLEKKINSFTDFNDVAEALIARNYTSKGKIIAYGVSAGGLLVGAAVNFAPELYGGIVAVVPFVDAVNTISDASLPLTPPEWDEWGNPIEDPQAFATMMAYSPYDTIQAGASYPPILATGGLTDFRVTYWEPAKWIARLRSDTQGGPFLLRMNMGAGHGGSAARFEQFDERAHLYAFALDRLGKAKVPADADP